jgi:hypothetical protein
MVETFCSCFYRKLFSVGLTPLLHEQRTVRCRAPKVRPGDGVRSSYVCSRAGRARLTTENSTRLKMIMMNPEQLQTVVSGTQEERVLGGGGTFRYDYWRADLRSEM